MSRDVGLQLIVAYKWIKAVLEIALALLLVAGAGHLGTFRELAVTLEHHVTSRWSVLVGRALASIVSERGLHFIQIGLALDGILSAVEGWSLWRGYRWGPWLVVAATATPLPLEVLHVVHTHRISRAIVVLVNVVVVGYLASRIARTRRRY